MIDMTMLIGEGRPNVHGRLISPNVQQGSAVIESAKGVARWMTLVVSGGVYNAHRATCTVICIYCYGYISPTVAANPFAVPVQGTTPLHSQATYSNGRVDDFTSASNWSSNNTSVATVGAQTGVTTGMSVGSPTITANLPAVISCPSCTICSAFSPVCPVTIYTPSAGGAVTPTISGPHTVWWFNGQTPSGYATTITLTASPAGGSSYTWSITTSGSGRAAFNVPSGNAITLSGNALSLPAQDVSVQVSVTTATGTGTSAPYGITVQGPKSLVASPPPTDQCDADFGYLSFINYIILDNLGLRLPSSVGINESWTSSLSNDYAGTNWRPGTASGAIITNSTFRDEIGGEAIGLPAIPMPTCPVGPPTKIDHWGQEWRVGTTTAGAHLGARVQTDNIQKYLGYARHTNVVSPAP